MTGRRSAARPPRTRAGKGAVGPRERKVWIGAGVGALAVALVAGIGIVANGFDRTAPDLSDASVWVANTSTSQLGRANTEISALDTTVSLEGDGDVIAQDARSVVMHSAEKNTLTVVDPATASALGTVNLPEGEPEVVTAGSRMGILDPAKGEVWVRSLQDVSQYTPGAEPEGQVGTDAVVAVGPDGVWAGYSRTSSRITLKVPGRAQQVVDVDFDGKPADAEITLVGNEPVVYSPGSNELHAFGETTSLAGVVDDPASVRLAQPVDAKDAAAQDEAVLAHSGGLVTVGTGKSSVELPVDGMDSAPAAPVRADGCWYGAWAEGTAQQYCDERDPEAFGLASAVGDAPVTLRLNQDAVVADDPAHGLAWSLQHGGALISNWDDFDDTATTVQHHNDDVDVPPTPVKAQRPPEAKDDEFGARPGRANVLPVLLNDADRNADPLAITSVTPPPATVGRVEIVENNQKLQFTPRSDATGTVSFSYTVDDGNGGQDSARVSVRLVGEDVNNAPEQVRSTRTTVAQGGQASVEALEDWVDPESDSIYLESATANAPNRVGAEATGRLDLTQGGGEPGLDTVRVRVSDGKATGNGSVKVTVTAKGRAPIITENTTLVGRIGTEVVTTPTDLARGGDGDLRLTRAEVAEGEDGGLDASVVYADGSVKLMPNEPGEYKVTYAVSDGHDSATGTIRVVVQPVPEESSDPVVAPTTAFVRMKESMETDILSRAYDPAGGVLTVTAVTNPPTGATLGTAPTRADGIDTEIVDGQRVRVTLLKELEEPLQLKVTVSNGTSTSQGQLTLVQVPEPSTLQAPVAKDDRATVRAGEVVDIPVLRNDSHPDGKPLRLDQNLVAEPKAGLMVTTKDRLRFLAPDQPGTFQARYRVLGPDGREAVGQVDVTVTELDAAENRAPSAPSISARSRAGQPVTIPVPVHGADPDGDSVGVSAVVTAPRNGTLQQVSARSMVYVPNDVSEGTDTFTYRLTDALGASSVGTIRVGVQGPDAPVPGPDAADDLVTTRPGSELNLDVLANDVDSYGKGLRITSATVPSGEAKAETDGKRVQVRAPDAAGSVSVLYTVEDARGAQSTAWLTLDINADAPAAAPEPEDQTLTLSQVDGRESVPVDVLSSTHLSEGDRSGLKVSLPEGWSDASVDAQGRVVVSMQAERSIIPFTVSRTDAEGAEATAFITVPGIDEAPPELRDDAPALKVTTGQDLDIDLSKQVIAAKGRSVGLVNTDSVLAMNGTAEPLDRRHLRFRSAEGYWGPAAVSVPITDGRTASVVILAITVQPEKNPAPVMRRANVSVESAESTRIDLRESTDVAGQGEGRFAGLTWSVNGGDAGVASAQVSGHTLVVTAAKGAKPGTSTQAQVTVTDAEGRTSAAAMEITVTSSTKPPPLAHDDEIVLRRGESKDVNVLANDDSPFPGRNLELIGVETATAVEGVQISKAGSKVRVGAAKDARTGTATAVYQVQDATGDATRRAEGLVRVVVQDVPGAPGAPSVTRYPEDAAVELSVSGAEPNGSAIQRYEYQVDGSEVGTCTGGPRACRVTGLSYGVDHSFRMRAVNGVGAGPWSRPSASVMMDRQPGAPTQPALKPSREDRSGTTLLASWKAPASAPWGSDVTGYTVKLIGPGLPDGGIVRQPSGTNVDITDSRIRAGQEYRLVVVAKNKRMTSETAAANATAVAAPRIDSAVAGLGADGETAEVEFKADGRGASTQAHIALKRSGDSAGSCSTDGFKSNVDGSTWKTALDPGKEPVFTVRVSNGLFCTKAVTEKVDTKVGAPGGTTWTKDEKQDETKHVRQPYYRIDAGNPSAKHFFVAFSNEAPDSSSGRWNSAPSGKDQAFGENDEAVTVWAMNCRTAKKSFCSPPKKLGTQTKRSVDLSLDVEVQGEQCIADGETEVRVSSAHGAQVRAGWSDSTKEEPSSFEDVKDGRIVVEAREPGEKVYLWTESSKHGFTVTRYDDRVTCEGPEPSDE
ncbi:MAG: Ig-like domain-containing protein [Galactobacter sp.]